MTLLLPSDAATATHRSSDDLALLRRFEPVLCFNRGEQFYPMDVDRYLAEAALYIKRHNENAQELVPRGHLNADLLVERREPMLGSVYYLSVADPLPAAQVRAFRRASTLKDFHRGPGRLARVGLVARLGDLFFSLSLFLRGRAPGGLAASAALRYQALRAQEPRYCYYGRVVREHGYIALQYWFFYAYNDWRSSFQGGAISATPLRARTPPPALNFSAMGRSGGLGMIRWAGAAWTRCRRPPKPWRPWRSSSSA